MSKKIDILKDLLQIQLEKYPYLLIGSNVYFLFQPKPIERYAIVKLFSEGKQREFNGVSIDYVNKSIGLLDHCEILFADVFDGNTFRATINLGSDDTFDWYQTNRPTASDLATFSDHVERYFEIIAPECQKSQNLFSDMQLAQIGQLMQMNSAALHGGAEARLTGDSGLLEVSSEAEPNVTTDNLGVINPAKEVEARLLSDEQDRNTEESEEVIVPVETEILEETKAEEEEVISDPAEQATEFITSVHKDSSISSVSDGQSTVSDESVENEVPMKAEKNVPLENQDIETEKEQKQKRKGSLFPPLFGKRESSQPVENEVPAREENTIESWSIGANDASDIAAHLKTFDGEVFSLEIVGQGSMKDFKQPPWNSYRNKITNIVIEDGIFNIGNYAFQRFSSLEEVILPNSITCIGKSSFEYCSSLEKIKLPNRLAKIDDFAFSGCEQLTELKLPKTLKEIKDYVFEDPKKIKLLSEKPENIKIGEGLSYEDFTMSNDIVASLKKQFML